MSENARAMCGCCRKLVGIKMVCPEQAEDIMTEDMRTILIVDDDHVILDFLEDVLQRSYSVIRAGNGNKP